MPSPVAHLAVGFALRRLLGPRTESRRRFLVAACFLFLSILPDLDAIPGVLLGDFGRYHNNLTNSVAFVMVSAAIASVVARLLKQDPLWWFAAALACLSAHVVMDLFTVGRGVMLAWPFSHHRFKPPFTLFYGLHWSGGVWDRRHLVTLVTESCFVLVLFVVPLARALRRSMEARAGNDTDAGTGSFF